jgi:hypothetical protein
MVRPRKELPENVKKEQAALVNNRTLWDQLAPLLFDKDNLLVLLSLRIAKKQGANVPFSRIGDGIDLGKSQKLADTLDYLVRCGLVRRADNGYTLTDRLGVGFTTFAGTLIRNLQKDLVRQPWLDELVDVLERETELEQAEVKNSVRTKTF